MRTSTRAHREVRRVAHGHPVPQPGAHHRDRERCQRDGERQPLDGGDRPPTGAVASLSRRRCPMVRSLDDSLAHRWRAASKHSTVVAIATFRLSARPRCSMRTHSSIGASGSRPADSLPATMAIRPVQSASVCADPAVRGGADESQPGRADGVERGRHHSDVEQRAGGRPHHLRAHRIDRAGRDDHGPGAGGLGRAHDRAEVAGVGDAVGHHDEVGGDQQGVVDRRQGDDGEQPRRGLEVGHPLGDTRRQSEHRVDTGDRRHVGGRVETLDRPAGGHDLVDQRPALHHEGALVRTRTAAPEQAPQSLNPGVREAQFEAVAQRAALAASTRAPNAAGSFTASSARILRSTSTPAAFRPAMNRL